jgi:hypothetical protein
MDRVKNISTAAYAEYGDEMRKMVTVFMQEQFFLQVANVSTAAHAEYGDEVHKMVFMNLHAVDMPAFDLHAHPTLPPLHKLAIVWIRERWRGTDEEEIWMDGWMDGWRKGGREDEVRQ